MAVGLESNHRRRVRVDPHDAHHYTSHAPSQSQSRHWWHWRSHKKETNDVDGSAAPTATTTTTRPPLHDQHHPGRYHSNDQFALQMHRSALSKRLSSTIHDDPPTVHGRRKRIVLHAIFKC